MDPKKKVEGMLRKAREIQEQQGKSSSPITQEPVKEAQTIPTATIEEAPSLPELYTGVSSLSLSHTMLTTKEQILSNLAPDAEVYKDVKLSKEQAQRINKVMGKMTTGASSVIPMQCRGSACSYHTKCVDGDTKVLVNFGSMSAKIKDLKKGDQIFSLSPDNYIVKDVITEVVNAGIKECFKVVTEHSNEIVATFDHPFKVYDSNTQTFKWMPLAELMINSRGLFLLTVELEDTFTENFNDVYLDKIVHIEEVGFREVYDVTVRDNSNFIAENLISHNCQPADEVVLTTNGYKKIQDLDSTVDRVVSMNKKGEIISEGRDFTLHERPFQGNLLKLSNNIESYKCTSNHITYAAFNEKAIKKHVVYMMQKGDYFRIGVTTLIQEMKGKPGKDFRYQFGLRSRLNMEKADKAWILGVYDTRVEALLDEEYYSIKAHAPKSLFISDDATRHLSTWNGKSKWSTQEQLDNQFRRLNENTEFYIKFLSTLGLDYNYPFLVRKIGKGSGGTEAYLTTIGKLGEYRACNLLPDVMDLMDINKDFSTLKVEKEFYNGIVYSLNVAEDHNYFTGDGILTKNCPYYSENAHVVGEDCLPEVLLIEWWTQKYIEEFDIDMQSITELHTVSRLVEITIKENRMNLYMSIHDQDLMQDFITSVDEAGNQITNKGASTTFIMREQLDKAKIKLLETLNATRERKSKIQLGAAKTINEASNLANIKNTLENLAIKLAKDSLKTVN